MNVFCTLLSLVLRNRWINPRNMVASAPSTVRMPRYGGHGGHDESEECGGRTQAVRGIHMLVHSYACKLQSVLHESATAEDHTEGRC